MEEEEEEDTDVGVQLRAKIKASGLPDLSVGSQSEEEGVWGCWEAWGRGRGALARGYARDWWGAAGGAGVPGGGPGIGGPGVGSRGGGREVWRGS